jgi:hypothetical protein
MSEATKETLEKEHSESMNQEAIERIKQEEASKEEIERREAVFFEDDEVIKLRDGKTYRVPPLNLKNARKLMQKIRTINIDAVILNFLPTGDEEADAKRQDDLYEVLQMAFVNYPEVDRDYIDEYVDLENARNIFDTLVGINAIKK